MTRRQRIPCARFDSVSIVEKKRTKRETVKLAGAQRKGVVTWRCVLECAGVRVRWRVLERVGLRMRVCVRESAREGLRAGACVRVERT